MATKNGMLMSNIYCKLLPVYNIRHYFSLFLLLHAALVNTVTDVISLSASLLPRNLGLYKDKLYTVYFIISDKDIKRVLH